MSTILAAFCPFFAIGFWRGRRRPRPFRDQRPADYEIL
jgi:hypothetical protein